MSRVATPASEAEAAKPSEADRHAAIMARLDEMEKLLRRLNAEDKPDLALLTVGEVTHLTTLSPREIHRRVKLGRFPKPKVLGESRRGWEKRDVLRWIRQQPGGGF